MTTLDEALARVTAEWVLTNDEWKELEPIVAAARNWHTLTNADAVERGAKALAYEAGKDITDWDSTPDQFLNPWREKARIVVDALSVTAEPE